jgi:putative oxidoreductase
VSAVPTRVSELARRLSATRDSPVARDVAMLGARIALAWLFIYHGAATLFGSFGGSGLHSATIFFATVAHLRPGGFWAELTGIIELGAGVAVGIGVLGRLAAASLVGVMVGAMVTVTFDNGIVSSATGGGYEINVALAALAFVVAMLGTGRFGLDTVIRSMTRRTAPNGGDSPRSGPPTSDPASAGLYEVESSRGDS